MSFFCSGVRLSAAIFFLSTSIPTANAGPEWQKKGFSLPSFTRMQNLVHLMKLILFWTNTNSIYLQVGLLSQWRKRLACTLLKPASRFMTLQNDFIKFILPVGVLTDRNFIIVEKISCYILSSPTGTRNGANVSPVTLSYRSVSSPTGILKAQEPHFMCKAKWV